MRLLLDGHINPAVAKQLCDQGYDVVTVQEVRMRGSSDEELLSFASGAKRAIVTYNIRDFQILLADWHRAGRHHAGIIFVSERTATQTRPGLLVRALARLLEKLSRSHTTIADCGIFLKKYAV
jgi:predicted nuclease of predicted toxin-antitoxin system